MNKIITAGMVLVGLSLIFINANNSSNSMSLDRSLSGGMQASVISSINSKDSCNVSNRKYGFVSIAHHVGTPELFTNFTDCPTKTAVKSGDWSDQSTWGGSVPRQGDIVLIPKNTTVTLSNSASVKTAGVAGSLVFNDRSNINFEVENFQTLSGSSLTITPTDSVVHKIVFTGNVETHRDPGQYGLGLIGMDSNIKINGRSTRATNSKIVSANAGSNSITVADDISDWKVGQNVIFADTQKVGDEYVPHTEIKKITSISGNVLTIDINSPLSYTYKSSVVYAGQNVIFTSNSPVPGHILFTGDTKLDFSGVYIEKMGRTRSAPVASVNFSTDGEVLGLPNNQIGRYSLHAHHLELPYNISGNIINNTGDPTLRWSATLHASYGSFTNNSIVNPGEAAIGIETYIDTGDVTNNLVIGSGGGAEYGQMFQSFGIWSRSPFMNINNNRVEGWTKSYSYFIDPDGSQFYVGKTFSHIHGSPTAGKVVKDQEKPGTFNGNVNTAYVGFAKGNEFRRSAALWLGHFFGGTYLVDNFKSTKGGIVAFYSRDFYFNNVKLNETEQGSNSSQFGYVGIQAGPAIFTNSEITGFQAGYLPGPTGEFKNGKLDNKIDFVSMIGDQDCFCHGGVGGSVVIDSTQFSPTGMHVMMATKFAYSFELFRKLANPSEIYSDLDVIMKSSPEYIYRMLNLGSRVVLKNYNNQGQDYIVYPTYQAADYKVPVFGISNQDLYDGKGTISYSVGMYGRSLGDYIVKNPIANSKIFGLVENVKPYKILINNYDFQPFSAASGYTLRYYTNSPTVKINLSNFLAQYSGDEHVINNFKAVKGLNKIQVKVDNNPYTLLFYGPDGLPTGTQPTDQPVVIDTPITPNNPVINKPIDIPATKPIDIPANKPIPNQVFVPLKPVGSKVSQITISTTGGQTTFGLGNVVFYSNGPVGIYKWNIVDSNGIAKTVSNGNVIQTLYYDFTTPGVYSVSLTILDRDSNPIGVSNTINLNIIPKVVVSESLPPISTVSTVATTQNLSGTCPYNTNVSIPAGQSSVTVYANLLSQYASGGTAPYTVDPSNLTFYASQKFLVNLNVRDSAGRVVSVPCNFNVSLSPSPTQSPSQTPQTSTSQVSIMSDSNKTTFGLGNVVFYSNGPVGIYKWNIVDSNGIAKTVSNGNVIQTLYYNFTTPGVYSVSLTILDANGNSLGTSNTVQVTITNSNGATVFSLFDWFVGLFVGN